MGRYKTQVISECRTAIKNNNVNALFKIIKSGSNWLHQTVAVVIFRLVMFSVHVYTNYIYSIQIISTILHVEACILYVHILYFVYDVKLDAAQSASPSITDLIHSMYFSMLVITCDPCLMLRL